MRKRKRKKISPRTRPMRGIVLTFDLSVGFRGTKTPGEKKKKGDTPQKREKMQKMLNHSLRMGHKGITECFASWNVLITVQEKKKLHANFRKSPTLMVTWLR